MAKDNSRDLDLAHAFAGVLSGREFGTLKVAVGEKIGYNPKTDTITLPGIPFGDVPEDLKEDLRAYIAHESIGERGHSHWNPAAYPDPQLKAIINGMNDARIDRIALNEWPGAGMSIRSRVQLDWQEFKKRMRAGLLNVKDPGVLSSALRYIGENVATAEEVAKTSPEMAKIIKKIQPALSATDFDGTEEHVIKQAQEVCRLANLPDPPPEPESGGSSEPSEGSESDEEEEGEGEGASQGEGKGDGEAKKKAEVGKESKTGDSESKQGKSSEGKTEQEEQKGEPKKSGPIPPGAGGGKPFGNMEERLMEKLKQTLDPITSTRSNDIFTIPPKSIFRKVPRSTPYEHERHYGSYIPKPVASRAVVGRIMRLFRSLQAAEDRVILKHRLLGELDPDRLADLHRGSQRLFSARKRGETESLAVYISVDNTGSISHTWLFSLKSLVLSFNEALGRLEIPAKIVAWSGGITEYRGYVDGYTQNYSTDFTDMKDWDTPWKKAENQIKHTMTGSANCDVPAIADGISALARRRETRKLFMYLTDGLPCVDGKAGTERLLAKTMKQLVERGKQQGITTVACGIGLGGGAYQTMNTIFGEGNYADVKGDLETAISTQFEKAVKRIIHQTERGIR